MALQEIDGFQDWITIIIIMIIRLTLDSIRVSVLQRMELNPLVVQDNCRSYTREFGENRNKALNHTDSQ